MAGKPVQGQYVWIARRSGRLTSPYAGRATGVCGRHVRGTRARHEGTGEVPVPRRPGRRPKAVPPAVERRALAARRGHGVGAVAPGRMLGIPGLSHSATRRILAGNGMVDSQGRRAKRAPWVRHGRTHSSSPSHTDRALLPGKRWPVAHRDDASRPVMGYGIFSSATSASAASVLHRAIRGHGKPASAVTDRGTQSCATGNETRRRGATEFERFLVASDMRHDLSGVGHPQTNGKTGRLFGEARARPGTFAGAGEIVAWWNTAKPHRSLDFARGETPCEALGRKIPPEGARVRGRRGHGRGVPGVQGAPGSAEGGA